MKLSIEKPELLRGLGRIQAIVEKRNSMPILANVLIGADSKAKDAKLTLIATDLEVGVRSEHVAAIEKTGSLTVSAKKFYEIVRELPEETIQLAATANSYLSIICGRSKFTLAGTAAEEYPSFPEFKPEKTVSVSVVALGAMIEQTLYAASADETRYNLNGVYLEQVEDSDRIRMVATDGHRLALVERSLGVDTSSLASGVIIPRKGLAELKRLVDEDDVDEIELAFEGNNGLARKGGVTLVMRLIDGEFPNYQQVIPKEIPHRIALETDVLVRSLRRVVILSTERARAVRLEIEDNKITLSSKNPDLGDAHEEIDVDYKGDPISIGFNARYLLDALSAMGAKEIELGIRDGLQPVQVTNSTDPECFAVIMPMRIPT